MSCNEDKALQCTAAYCAKRVVDAVPARTNLRECVAILCYMDRLLIALDYMEHETGSGGWKMRISWSPPHPHPRLRCDCVL